MPFYCDCICRSYDLQWRSLRMLVPILGSLSSERVLIFILTRREGYAREIARFFETDLDPIQKQLEKLELGSILVSRTAGRTRLYEFNPRYTFLKELDRKSTRLNSSHGYISY